ncbi:preprotein translocase subunit SecG [Pseudorhodoferax sp. Leaf265]|uniref:preprotein translocase subunit SecG n=1 Tax=Pseudorhodoferax sp. Leaf265 TaxID=1736315 RepID=UPI0006F947C5|nr:preprotein translocase subunit SecG [Pseudorhodoferax sp. Leaf265]KQP19842.1 preprotein translocase subunit SecG [Pseudorhodoferax sp. Leaf265]
MNVLLNLVLAVQILSALGMIGLILIQHGKGADMGAAFGSGSAGSLFGASGSANFLSRTTAVLAVVFFVATLALAYFGNRQPTSAGSVLERAVQEAPAPASQIPGSGVSAPAAPAVPASGAGQIPTQ